MEDIFTLSDEVHQFSTVSILQEVQQERELGRW